MCALLCKEMILLTGFVGGRNSSLVGCDPPLKRSFFSGRGDFSLGVNMGSDSIP